MKKAFRTLTAFILASAVIISAALYPVDSMAVDSMSSDSDVALDLFSRLTGSFLIGETKIDISDYGLDKDTFTAYMLALYNYDPLSFLIANTYSYTHNKSIVTSVNVTNTFSPEDALGAIVLYKNAVNDCVKGIHGDWTDESKLLYVFEYMANHFTYDHSLAVADAYGLVTEGRGVCQAFTLFASGVLDRLGIENDTMVSQSINHIWNRVKLDGEWYNIDFTWANLDVYGNCVHDYFLRSDTNNGVDTDFKLRHTSDVMDWRSSVYTDDNAATDFYVNSGYCWYDTDTCFVFVNGFWYYLASAKGSKTELRRTSDFHDYETVQSFADYFLTDEGLHWSGYWGGLKVLGTKILFTTAKQVIIYDTVSGGFEVLFEYEGDAANSIYGLGDRGDTVDLLIRDYPPTGGSESYLHDVETVEFVIPEEYLPSKELVDFAENLEYYYDEENEVRLIFGVSEGDYPGTLVAALGGDVLTHDGKVFSKSAVLTTGSIFTMGELEYLLSIPGDTDMDGRVDEEDAEYLLTAMLFPDYNPVVYEQDYDGNGSFDTDDTLYLLLSRYDPAGFPIYIK